MESLEVANVLLPLLGTVWCLSSALLYAIYACVLDGKLKSDSTLRSTDILLGIGIVSLLLPTPISLLLGEVPNWEQLGLLIVMGIFDNVLSQLLYLYGIKNTSATIATVGLSFTVVQAAISDVVRGAAVDAWTAAGAVAVTCGFLLMAKK